MVYLRTICACLSLGLLTAGTSLHASNAGAGSEKAAGCLRIGWASADITPDKPVVIAGGSSARVSEGVRDPICATALAMESIGNNGASDMVVMVSLDLVGVTGTLYGRVQELGREATPEIDADKIILNVTHMVRSRKRTGCWPGHGGPWSDMSCRRLSSPCPSEST